MSRKKNDLAYVWDMLTAAKLVQEFSADQTYHQFLHDRMRKSAIERQIEIIGEAANRVSKLFQAEHPEIPWNKIISQRNILIHEYDDLEYEILWNVATKHIPQLIIHLERILPEDIPEVEL